jgi:hypothetical protein
MVLARWLFQNAEWLKSLSGPKIIVEHDAYLNFMPQSPYYKCWTKLYRACNFDLIISSGKETTYRLREEGLPAVWVPKGTNAEFLTVPNQSRGTMGYFACPIAEQETGNQFYFYESRYKMAKKLQGVIGPIACPFGEFASVVSGYSGVATNDETMNEPMAKQFECSALGSVVIRDYQPELEDLGYKHKESVLFYHDFDELMEIIDYYKNHADELMVMGNNARKVAANHTWTHRAHEISKWVRHYHPTRAFL